MKAARLMRERWAVSVLTVVPIQLVIRGCWRGHAGGASQSAASSVVRSPVVLSVRWAALAATPRRRMLVVLGVDWISAGGTRTHASARSAGPGLEQRLRQPRTGERAWCWVWVG